MYRTALVDKIESVMNILNVQSGVIFEFEDSEIGTQLLSSFKSIPEVSYAAFYTTTDSLISSYHSKNLTLNMLDMVNRRGELDQKYKDSYFHLEKDVLYDGKKVGRIVSISNFASVDKSLNRFLSFQIFLFFLLLIASFYLSNYVQSILIRPIQKLAAFMFNIASTKNYNSRIKKKYDDEIGVMYENFNQLLDEVESKSFEIETINSGLEAQIKERTQELELAMNEALKASELKSKFIAQISHELRTPLNSILGYADLLLGDEKIEQASKDQIEIINKSGMHLLELINSFLDISLIESGKTNVSLSAFKVSDLLKNISDLFVVRFRNKGLDFRVENNMSSDSELISDVKKLTQILINILSNSLKYTNAGFVNLEATCNDEVLSFIISDSGIGIPENKLKKIQEPFEQLNDDALSNLTEGVGLGLSIATNFTQLIDGKFTIESEYGRGTTVTINLPYLAVADSFETIAAEKMKNKDNPKKISEGYKLLIVDDVLENRELVRTIINRYYDFDVYEAENGKEAVSKYETHQPDVIIMDIRMPVMDGYEAIKIIRSLDFKSQQVPIIVLTASVFAEKRKRIFEVGATAYLSKPFRLKEFNETLKEHFFDKL